MSGQEMRLVHIVDDDEAMRRSVGFALKTSAASRCGHTRAAVEILKEAPDLETGCILLDIRMPGMDGLEVQEALKGKGVTLPVIIMTGHGDVSLAVRAMKAGAIDFIEKPFEKAVLLSAIEQAMGRLKQSATSLKDADEAATRLQLLTAREREVLDGLAKGLPNKSIAYDLGISPRTVEIHRANLMAKLEVKSLSEALRIAFAAEGNRYAT